MNRILCAAVLASLLAACSDKPAPAAATPPAVLGVGPVVATRPAAIPESLAITQDCSVDLVNDAIATEVMPVANKTQVRLSGWAADPVAGTLPKAVYLEIGGANKVYAQVALGVARPDVATHFSKPALATAGWQATLDMSAVKAGNYELRIIQLGTMTNTICDARKALTLI
ncbi:MAG: hypothetical protein CFE43_11855 [Burkholderiales bacterium PBB3]|nr:MAG: hypothetical protein CFE43_11855 [Burkholderiales bacterium PBB3]